MSGGDSFSVFDWEASPESEAAYFHYRDHLHMVPDLVSFDVAASDMYCSEKGDSVEVEDEDETNRLLGDQRHDDDAEERWSRIAAYPSHSLVVP